MSIENPTLAHFRHFIRRGGFSSLFTNLPAYKAADIYVPIRHYICREPSTNQLFLCKTNPILSAVGGLQTLVQQWLMKINPIGHLVKTNPIQTQPVVSLSNLFQTRSAFTPKGAEIPTVELL